LSTKTVLAWLFALLIAACGGGGHSPTAPAGFTTFATVLLNQNFAATIGDAKLVVDGVVVGDSASTIPASTVILVGMGNLGAGHHPLSVVIAAQTDSPSPYTTLAPDISFFDPSGTRIRELKLPDRSASLATGQSIDFSFDS
jgi:hypothetical protein